MDNFHVPSNSRTTEEYSIIRDMVNDFSFEEEDENLMEQADDCPTSLIHPY